jgi:carbamoyl-phosphate synthase small subunit
MKANLILSDGTSFEANSFGANRSIAGEVVFSTGMVGYPESLTDPSYKGQILVMTYPIIGNYGVPDKSYWESEKIMASGLIVSNYNDTPSHYQSERALAKWFKDENLPLIEIKDTRVLAQKLRDRGTMLGKIIIDKNVPDYDPNTDNPVAQVSTKKIQFLKAHGTLDTRLPAVASAKEGGTRTILLIDCGIKNNTIRNFLNRGVNIIRVPWDTDPFSPEFQKTLDTLHIQTRGTRGTLDTRGTRLFDALFISNGPGDPKMADKTIATIKKSLENKIPTMGICLGNQLLALAAGGDTYKLKFGHRSQNQPCIVEKTGRCYITTQNHGFAINQMPQGFNPWFTNANDNTIEGIIHNKHPFMAVQFHPESTPGPKDTEWIFDYFLDRLK